MCYKLENRLIPVYNQIQLSNGHNVSDPRLVDLARQMGGTPVEIWEDREYWGETNDVLPPRRVRSTGSESPLATNVPIPIIIPA